MKVYKIFSTFISLDLKYNHRYSFKHLPLKKHKAGHLIQMKVGSYQFCQWNHSIKNDVQIIYLPIRETKAVCFLAWRDVILEKG